MAVDKTWLNSKLLIIAVTALLSGGTGTAGGSYWMKSQLDKKANIEDLERLEGLVVSIAVNVCKLQEGADFQACDQIAIDYFTEK